MAADATRTEQLLQRSMATVDGLRARLQQQLDAAREPIAVVGVGCRFPGIEGPRAFADFIGRCGQRIGTLASQRRTPAAGPLTERYATGGFFEDIAQFDAEGFGIDAEQARCMDPQLRLLLEVTREALADAGACAQRLAGTRCAVLLALGAQNSDFQTALAAQPGGSRHAIAGSFHSLMPGRIAYHFDLRGPSLVVDAACASSLVAVDLACQSLRRGDCDSAIVASVNLVLSDVVSAAIDGAGLWSASGSCRAFDEAADGFVRGEGAVVLLLRRQGDAQRDGDATRALLMAAASGQDGRGNGFAAPNGPAQAEVMQRALQQAGLAPQQVAWVEAHATGTRLGDAIEVEAIESVYAVESAREAPLQLGALKPALGHLESASGLAALLKVILAREAGSIPPAPQPARLNSEIAALGAMIELPRSAQPWPATSPFAAVSAFGMSGTHAHVIVGPAAGAAQRVERSLPVPTARARYWPDFSSTPSLAPAPLPQGLFYQTGWQPLSAATAALPKRLAVCGDARLRARLLPALRGAGITLLEGDAQSVPPDIDAVLFAAGSAFVDLSALHGLVTVLARLPRPPGLFLVMEGGSAGNPLAAAAIGLGRGIAAEHPELRSRLIDLEPGQADPGAALLQALNVGGDETLLRVAGASISVPRLHRLQLAPGRFAPNAQGSHLVTGAFGGIGRAVTRWLVERGARHLLLLGRHALAYPELAEFEARGVQLRLIGADVAERSAVQDVFTQAEASGHPVASVFHIAGVSANALLAQQDAAAFAAPFRAKLLGASVLDAISRSRRVDAFVLFSSITGFVPLAGAAAYAAANASLGAIARARRAAGLPALCVHWGTWAGSGMADAAAAALAERWAEHGIGILDGTTALAALDALLAAGIDEAIAAQLDWTRIARHAERESSGSALFEQLLPKASEARPAAASDGDLHTLVCQTLARLLRLDPQDVRLQAPFGELGLDSLAAVELRNELSARLGLRLPATLAFNYPSAHALAGALQSRLQAQPRNRNPDA